MIGQSIALKVFIVATAFLVGVASGALVMNSLAIRSLRAYRGVLRDNLKFEQEFLAARAARDGDALRAVVHRWNAVDAESREGGFLSFRPGCFANLEDNFWIVLDLATLDRMLDEKSLTSVWTETPSGEARRIAMLAAELEDLGALEEAERQWARASALNPALSAEKLKELAAGFRALETEDHQLRAEEQFLNRCQFGG